MTDHKTTYDIHRESMTVPYVDPATEKQRNVTNLKAEIAFRERELEQLRVRLRMLEATGR